MVGRRRTGVERLLAGAELDARNAFAIIKITRRQLGQHTDWTDADRWLKTLNRFQLKEVREAVVAEMDAAEQRGRERRAREAQAAGGIAFGAGIGPGIRRPPAPDPELYISASGAIRSALEDRVEVARETERAKSREAEIAARKSQVAEQAAAAEQAKQARDQAAEAELLAHLRGHP